MLTDTHAHLYWGLYKDDLNEVLQRALDSGITTIINVGVDITKSKLANEQLKKLKEFEGIKFYSTIGLHPHEANKYFSPNDIDIDVSIHKDIEELKQIYQSALGQIVAVGECGLDYFFKPKYLTSPTGITLSEEQIKTLQHKLFKAQINFAKDLGLPLIIHIRDDRSKNPNNSECWTDALEMVGDHPTILHCYSGTPEITQKVIPSPNLFVSLAATITYPKNEYLRDAIKLLPLERLVLETDSPFLPSQSKRGERNEPSTIKEIAQLVAQIKEISIKEVAKKTSENVNKLLKL